MEMNAASANTKKFVYVGMHTPWGWADSVEVIVAEGIARVGTPSHGGFKLSPKMNAKVNAAWRNRGGWYEEDCEWAKVALTFPEHFPGSAEGATRTAKEYYPDEYTTVTGNKVETAESYVLRKREFAKVNAEKPVVIAAFGDWHKAVPKGMVGVVATPGGKREMGLPETKVLVPAAEYETRAEFGFVIEDATKYAAFNL